MRMDAKIGAIGSLLIVMVGYLFYVSTRNEKPVPVEGDLTKSVAAQRDAVATRTPDPAPSTGRRQPDAAPTERAASPSGSGDARRTTHPAASEAVTHRERNGTTSPPGTDASSQPPRTAHMPLANTSRGTESTDRPDPADARARLERPPGHDQPTTREAVRPSDTPAATPRDNPEPAASQPESLPTRVDVPTRPSASPDTLPTRADASPVATDVPALRPDTLAPGSRRTTESAHVTEPGTANSARTDALARRETPPDGGRPATVEHHRVQPGDTFTSLAVSYYGDARYTKFLIASNSDITDPNRLQVGQLVRIAPKPASPDALPAPAVPATVPGAAAPAAGATTAGRTYVVQSGDSFYAIARARLGNAARWRELFELNKDAVGGDPKGLKVGQTIRLPEK